MDNNTCLKNEKGLKFDKKKERLDLIPIYPLWELGKVYTYGANKYGDKNWREGMSWSRIIGAIFRHLYKWCMGERYDKESNLHHLSQVVFGCFTLMVYEMEKIGNDDRNKNDKDTLEKLYENERIHQ